MTLFGFINATEPEKDHPKLLIHSAIVVDQDGNYVARHVGPTKEDCKEVLTGKRIGSPWLEEYERKFPGRWTLIWVDEPEKDPRLNRIEHRFRKTRASDAPTGEEVLADDGLAEDGNPAELYDSLNHRVTRGFVSWEPLEGDFKNVLVFRALESIHDVRELRAARQVWSDPIIADANPSTGDPDHVAGPVREGLAVGRNGVDLLEVKLNLGCTDEGPTTPPADPDHLAPVPDSVDRTAHPASSSHPMNLPQSRQ